MLLQIWKVSVTNTGVLSLPSSCKLNRFKSIKVKIGWDKKKPVKKYDNILGCLQTRHSKHDIYLVLLLIKNAFL